MRIYRYLFKEVSNNFAAVAVVLFFIFVSGRFVKYLAEVAAGTISSKVLFSIMLFRMPAFMELIFPLALFLGVMLAYGRLYVESEMVVLQACGVSKRRLLFYTQGPAFIVMLLTAVFTLYITPLGWKHFHKLWNDPETYSGLGTLVQGSFKKFNDRDLVVYVAEMNSDKTDLQDVFVIRSSENVENNELTIIKSEAASVVASDKGQPYIELYRGMQYSGAPGQLEYTASRYDVYGQLLGASNKAAVVVDSVEALPTLALQHATGRKERVALQWRIALPFIVPIAAIIALALSETTHRKGRYLKLLPGILIYIVYIASLIGVRSQMDKGDNLPVDIALWLVHGVFLSLGLILLFFSDLKLRFYGKRVPI